MKYYLMRHAQTAPHPEDPVADNDQPLNDAGRAQAQRAATWLLSQKRRPDSIIASSTQRTMQTAGIVSRALGIPVTVDSSFKDAVAAKPALKLLTGRPLIVTHDHVIAQVTKATDGDWPVPGEVRRYKRKHTETKRFVP